MSFGFDHDHAPIVVFWWSGPFEAEDFTRSLEQLQSLFESWHAPGRIVFDFCDVEGFDAQWRRQHASWRAQNQRLFRTKIAASAYVFTSRLARGYLTAVDWLRPIDGVQRRVFGARRDAVEWLQGLDAAQVAQ
ncbi:MAG: STAS/SEC14 domain-containing protein [Nannocystaceae bacterium]|nr:STAS/SEC14 domain-containing protein [bacterium]